MQIGQLVTIVAPSHTFDNIEITKLTHYGFILNIDHTINKANVVFMDVRTRTTELITNVPLDTLEVMNSLPIIDTSGTVTDEMLENLLTEVKGIMSSDEVIASVPLDLAQSIATMTIEQFADAALTELEDIVANGLDDCYADIREYAYDFWGGCMPWDDRIKEVGLFILKSPRWLAIRQTFGEKFGELALKDFEHGFENPDSEEHFI